MWDVPDRMSTTGVRAARSSVSGFAGSLRNFVAVGLECTYIAVTGLMQTPRQTAAVQALRRSQCEECAVVDSDQPPSIFPRRSLASGAFAVRPLLLKPQWMNGLSERLLVSHYVNNYGGALRRLNAIRERL